MNLTIESIIKQDEARAVCRKRGDVLFLVSKKGDFFTYVYDVILKLVG
jgi:hypothetical protein